MSQSKYIYLIVTAIIFMGRLCRAQTWEKEVVGTLNLSQTGFDNWISGGENAFSWQLNLSGAALRTHHKHQLNLSGRTSYGETASGGFTKKNSDEIRLDGVYTYKIGAHVNPYASLNFNTQMTATYDTSDSVIVKLSACMEPGYFTQSAGIGVSPRPWLTARAGLAVKETFADALAVVYTDDPATAALEKKRIEPGAELMTEVNLLFNDHIKYNGKIECFINFKGIEAVDVNWDNQLSAQIVTYVAVNLNMRLLYDNNLSVKRQLREMVALGLTYNLFGKDL